jgi:outer membrane protein assembly factor BamB
MCGYPTELKPQLCGRRKRKEMKRRWLILAAVGAGLLSVSAFAEDSPQWRGPKRDGISQEKGLLKEWPQGGPKLLWQIKDAGFGYGSPAVAGDRFYILSSEGTEKEFVRALSVKDGSPIWSVQIGKVGNPDQQPSYPGARSTPTLDGEFLYALGSDGDLVCLEVATGKEVWKKNVRTEFGGSPGIWAYAESPLVDGEKVVVTPGGEQATLLALDKKNGAVLWKSAAPGGDRAGYSSVVATEIAGVKQYVQFLEKGLVGVDAATGKLLWLFDKSVDTRFKVHAATPLAYDGNVYSSSAAGGGVARVRAANGAFTTEAVFFNRKAPNSLGGAVKVGDYLYGTTNSVLLCVEAATGQIKWEDRAVGAGSVCYADGRLYVHGENGDVALVDATPDAYRVRGRFTPPEGPERGQAKAWAYPVVANGRLYIRDLGTLWCYDVQDASATK